MSKYEPLNVFLKKQGSEHVPMTFSEIESVLNDKLPASKSQRAWWSNNPNNNVMTKEWLDAGYETESVDIAGERLVFRQVKKPQRRSGSASAGYASHEQGESRCLHPGIGFMKGLISIQTGFDVSGPFSDEPWDEGYLGEDRLHEAGAGKRHK